jgi:hypothetical protein
MRTLPLPSEDDAVELWVKVAHGGRRVGSVAGEARV